ncbi:MAG: hypothetical protein RMY34_30110 [Aulosira sp. DedQUE10]|nr:hypothetical protein [Aulosira sp. DedQUE10]
MTKRKVWAEVSSDQNFERRTNDKGQPTILGGISRWQSAARWHPQPRGRGT